MHKYLSKKSYKLYFDNYVLSILQEFQGEMISGIILKLITTISGNQKNLGQASRPIEPFF